MSNFSDEYEVTDTEVFSSYKESLFDTSLCTLYFQILFFDTKADDLEEGLVHYGGLKIFFCLVI